MQKFFGALGIFTLIVVLMISFGIQAYADDSATVTKAQETVVALPSSSAVLVNGTAVTFQAYNIGGNNYFKLRDLAQAINGTEKQFEIGYDSINRAIAVTSGEIYTPLGDELTTSDDTSNQQAVLSSAKVYIDGTEAALTAYNIDGYNYFKLRDVAATIDFGVVYDEATRNIGIDTTTGYVSDSETTISTENPLIGAWHFTFEVDDTEFISYLIYDEDGNIIQFIGEEVSTFTADDSNISISSSGKTNVTKYAISFDNEKTSLYIDNPAFEVMTRDGYPTVSGADAIQGLWLSENDIYDDNVYFYFTKSGQILIGITLAGEYMVSGNTVTDNIADDRTFMTSTFEISEENGVTTLLLKDSEDNEQILYKE